MTLAEIAERIPKYKPKGPLIDTNLLLLHLENLPEARLDGFRYHSGLQG